MCFCLVSQCSACKIFISDKVTEAGKERLERVKNSWPVSVHHKHCENKADLMAWEWAERKREKTEREERLLGDSLASLPDLDPHQTLCIVHTGLSHMHGHIHSYTWTAISHFTWASLMLQQMNIEYRKKGGKSTNVFLSIIKIHLHCGILLAALLKWNSTREQICVTSGCKILTAEKINEKMQYIYTEIVVFCMHEYDAGLNDIMLEPCSFFNVLLKSVMTAAVGHDPTHWGHASQNVYIRVCVCEFIGDKQTER